MEIAEQLAATRFWIEKLVIGLNLCPFARVPFEQEKIRFSLTLATNAEALLAFFLEEANRLQTSSLAEIETTLIIHPNFATDFQDYLDLTDHISAWLEDSAFAGQLQLATFHPDYQFEGTEANDPENFTNRSPFPMLHLLREDSVAKAISFYGDTSQIPTKNIQTLNELGISGIQKMLS